MMIKESLPEGTNIKVDLNSDNELQFDIENQKEFN